MCQLFLFVGSTAVLEAPLAQPACPTVFDPVGSMLPPCPTADPPREPMPPGCENGRESRNKESRAHGCVA
jgi:hypothetical protein